MKKVKPPLKIISIAWKKRKANLTFSHTRVFSLGEIDDVGMFDMFFFNEKFHRAGIIIFNQAGNDFNTAAGRHELPVRFR